MVLHEASEQAFRFTEHTHECCDVDFAHIQLPSRLLNPNRFSSRPAPVFFAQQQRRQKTSSSCLRNWQKDPLHEVSRIVT